MFAEGKSMGGRMGAMVAARQAFTAGAAGLISSATPASAWKAEQRRDKHLGHHGADVFRARNKDPFGTPDEMPRLVEGLPGATFTGRQGRPFPDRETWPAVSGDVIDRVVGWTRQTHSK